MSRLRRIGAAFVCFVAFTHAARAQVPRTGELHGTVTDQTGAVVVGASVVLSSDAGQNWSQSTDGLGRYKFTDMPPGTYDLKIGSEGFKDFAQRARIRASNASTINAELKIAISVSMDVKEPSGLSTDPRRNASSIILTGKDLDALPDDPNAFLLRLMQIAGAVRPGDVEVYIDGFRDYKRLPPKQAIAMIRINSNPFSAEFSGKSTRRIEITTKPGSDSFAGDLKFQARDSVLNARNALADDKPPQHYRNVNGYLQGPLKKEKVGFLLYGGRWQQDEMSIVHATVLNPRADATQLFNAAIPAPMRSTSVLFKTDFKVFDQLINATFTSATDSRRAQGLEGGLDLPERAYDRTSRDDVGRIWWTTVMRRAVNDVRFELTRSHSTSAARLDAPAAYVLDAFNAGGNQDANTSAVTNGLQAIETVTFQRGRHTMKTGLQLESARQDSVDRSGFGGAFTFGAGVERDALGNPVIDATGQPASISPIENYRRTLLGLRGYGPSQFSIVQGNPNVAVTQWRLGSFFMDDWPITKLVSLSYGIRQESQNNLSPRMNLAPRVYLSWLLDKDGSNAIKIGSGVFYAPVDSDITFETRRLDGAHQQQLIVQNPSFFTTIPSALASSTSVESAVYVKAPELQMSSSIRTSIDYERQLPWNLWAVVGYHHDRGRNLLRLRNIGAIAPLFQYESTGRSSQHELLLALRGGIGKSKSSVYANYTLARRTGDTDGASTLPADPFNLAAEWGPLSSDRRHEFVIGASLALPRGVFLSPYVTATSGRPFNITTGKDNNGDTVFTDRPSFALSGDPGAVATPYGLLNPNPRPGEMLIPRNFGREPAAASVNLTLSKSFPAGVTFSIDVENLLNETRLTGSTGVLTAQTFGMMNRALEPRRFELGIRYSF
jgi:hypothetical protein